MTNLPVSEEACPCMGTLSLRVVVKMWSSLPENEECSGRKEVSTKLMELLDKYPSGGHPFLIAALTLAEKQIRSCKESEAAMWDYVASVVRPRLETVKITA